MSRPAKNMHHEAAHSKKTVSKVPENKKQATKILSSKPSRFGKLYSYAAVFVLFATTTVWALFGARLQQANADQLVDSRFFAHWNTFHSTVFPSAHSFLLKWPLFWFVRLAGFSSTSFLVATLSVTFLTVGSLAYIMYRIDRRPAVFGTLMMALASILLLVPPQASAGALLPVSMAMLTTRNIEYVWYIASLALLVKSRTKRDYRLWVGIGGLALLIASDKLFLSLSLGGTLVALGYYLTMQRPTVVRQTLKWLSGVVLAVLLAAAVLWLINKINLTHTSSAATNSPFGIVHNLRAVLFGIFFALLGIATNFGANPAYDTGVISQIITNTKTQLFSVAGMGYAVNFVLLLAGLYAVWRLFRLNSTHSQPKLKNPDDAATKLSVLLLGSSLASMAAFVLTNHYYAADARYLSISLFAVAISAATYLRSKKIYSDQRLAIIVSLLIVSILGGLVGSYRTYRTDTTALADTQQRNQVVANTLANHRVDVLVGDYWRVVPIQQQSAKAIAVMPLESCSQPQTTLTSKSWELDLHKHSFAYLLSLDHSVTDKPVCTLDQVILAYGRPNANVVVRGTTKQPQELLLYYDSGIRRVPATPTAAATAATKVTTPVSIDDLSKTNCDGSTTMNIVAHQDDDLLFMNPDISTAIKAGKCVVTAYITAGDAGIGEQYWLSRELGAEAAYATMAGMPNTLWIQRTVELTNSAFLTVASPLGKHNVRLIFFRLPDGDISGAGFKATGKASLERLKTGQVKALASVDKQSSYTSETLTTAIQTLMQSFQPSFINTLATFSPSKRYMDHSDHMAVGRYVQQAYGQSTLDKTSTALRFYYGYPIRDMLPNVTEPDLTNKALTFMRYVRLAHGTDCNTLEDCLKFPSYGSYLRRQYYYELPK